MELEPNPLEEARQVRVAGILARMTASTPTTASTMTTT